MSFFNFICKKKNHFNLGLYAAISCFLTIHPRLNYPSVVDRDKNMICNDFDIDLSAIETTLGQPVTSLLKLLIYCYFEYPQQFFKIDPTAHQLLDDIFKKNQKVN